LDKAQVERRLNERIAIDALGGQRWITDEGLEANPALVKKMSVKPPTGAGRARLVALEGLDLQPCGAPMSPEPAKSAMRRSRRSRKKGKINRRLHCSRFALN
jgi:misacylated tRNA(Ala) deacylase